MEHEERLVDVHELAAYLEVPVKTLLRLALPEGGATGLSGGSPSSLPVA